MGRVSEGVNDAKVSRKQVECGVTGGRVWVRAYGLNAGRVVRANGTWLELNKTQGQVLLDDGDSFNLLGEQYPVRPAAVACTERF